LGWNTRFKLTSNSLWILASSLLVLCDPREMRMIDFGNFLAGSVIIYIKMIRFYLYKKHLSFTESLLDHYEK
jgi:hypothetical protein